MKTGDLVKIEFGISDPLKRQGQTGKIIAIESIDEDDVVVKVRFEDGVEGEYFENCVSLING